MNRNCCTRNSLSLFIRCRIWSLLAGRNSRQEFLYPTDSSSWRSRTAGRVKRGYPQTSPRIRRTRNMPALKGRNRTRWASVPPFQGFAYLWIQSFVTTSIASRIDSRSHVSKLVFGNRPLWSSGSCRCRSVRGIWIWQSNPAVSVGKVLCQVLSIQRLDASASSSVLTQGCQ